MSFRALASPPSTGGNSDAGVLEKASLVVTAVDSTSLPQGPAMYEVIYTRGGWIWRTSHRFRDWLQLKDSLKQEFGTRNLPDDSTFPKKENVGALVTKVLTSCQGCRESGGPVGILEARRQGFQAYFLEILVKQRDIWDSSNHIQRFFFPGPPTSYSAALARLRIDEINEAKPKSRDASSTLLSLSSKFKSFKFGSIFDTSPSDSAPSPALSTQRALPVASREDTSSASPSSMLNRISATMPSMPSLTDVLFDVTAASKGIRDVTSKVESSRHNGIAGSQNSTSGCERPQAPISNPYSESGPADGISQAGGSKHSI